MRLASQRPRVGPPPLAAGVRHPHIAFMPSKNGALAAPVALTEDEDLRLGAEIIDLDDVARRRERLQTYAQATRSVIVYRFMMAPAATIAAGGQLRDARAQLEAMVGLTGGALTHHPGGLAARIPTILAAKFENLAASLIGAYLVSFDLGGATAEQ